MQVRVRKAIVVSPEKYILSFALIDLSKLPIEIPPELLATGGTITIQKRKVSVTKTAS